MKRRIKPKGQDFMDWLEGLVAQSPEAQRAYEQEAAIEEVRQAIENYRAARARTALEENDAPL